MRISSHHTANIGCKRKQGGGRKPLQQEVKKRRRQDSQSACLGGVLSPDVRARRSIWLLCDKTAPSALHARLGRHSARRAHRSRNEESVAALFPTISKGTSNTITRHKFDDTRGEGKLDHTLRAGEIRPELFARDSHRLFQVCRPAHWRVGRSSSIRSWATTNTPTWTHPKFVGCQRV